MELRRVTLPETNIRKAPENRPKRNRKVVRSVKLTYPMQR